ncbi:MAG: hypothetical protein GY851_16055 [bacterium]|nr:hypothetical protein [bacterium]
MTDAVESGTKWMMPEMLCRPFLLVFAGPGGLPFRVRAFVRCDRLARIGRSAMHLSEFALRTAALFAESRPAG